MMITYILWKKCISRETQNHERNESGKIYRSHLAAELYFSSLLQRRRGNPVLGNYEKPREFRAACIYRRLPFSLQRCVVINVSISMHEKRRGETGTSETAETALLCNSPLPFVCWSTRKYPHLFSIVVAPPLILELSSGISDDFAALFTNNPSVGVTTSLSCSNLFFFFYKKKKSAKRIRKIARRNWNSDWVITKNIYIGSTRTSLLLSLGHSSSSNLLFSFHKTEKQ